MSGSIKWFGYTTDDGEDFGIRRDESSGEATATGGRLLADYTVGRGLPSTITTRYINVSLTTDPTVRRRFVVGTQTAFNAIRGNDTISEAAGGLAAAATWRVRSKRGERETLPTAGDSGQTDGDAT